jgi:hypothetical protein
MPLTSAFSPPGHFAFSSRKPRAQVIYESLRDGMGDTYEESFDGRQQARLYATAMCLASADLQNIRAGNNRIPGKATELLPELERDYQVIPPYSATLEDRRAVLSAREKAVRGNRREAVEDALSTLLGPAFVRYETTDVADIVAWPSAPGDVGVFAAPGAQHKSFSIGAAISLVGVPLSVPITLTGGSLPPVVGETYCVDPDSRGAPEKITVAQVLFDGARIVTTFARAHEPGTAAVRPHPMWVSNQRCVVVVVTVAAAQDPETRRQINELMARMMRGVTQWGITTDAGPFTPDDPLLGDLRVARPT